MIELREGQVWRRRTDGQLTVIVSPGSATSHNSWVAHRAKRLTHTERSNFFRKYELFSESTND